MRARRRRFSPPRVHERGSDGGARLDAMLELAEAASRPAPLDDVLATLASKVAALLGVDICSIYLRGAGSDLLALRATHGYPAEAVGRVQLRIGEGLTGFAVECLRPVSVARATFDSRNRAFPGLDEERFPSLCAVPLVDGGRAVGALVVQRRQPRAFGQREMVLVASLCAPVLFALERSRQATLAAAPVRPPVVETRPQEVLLRGVTLARGEGLGVAIVARAPAAPAARKLDVAEERARLCAALADAAAEVAGLEAWALGQRRVELAPLLSPTRFVLDDDRLREQMIERVAAGDSAETAVETALRAYRRAITALGDPLLAARALEVEALCRRVQARMAGPATRFPPGRVLCARALTVCDALELAATHGVAAVLVSDEPSTGTAVLSALGLPVVGGISELFRWVADGDRLLVGNDATLVNPSRSDIAAFRARRSSSN
jgi:phosphotransferase system enzyme I (PtsP)